MLVLHRCVFLDISKAFDRVCHEGLLSKLKLYGINCPLLNLLKSFLTNRFQRVVVLSDQTSNWKEILAGTFYLLLFFLRKRSKTELPVLIS